MLFWKQVSNDTFIWSALRKVIFKSQYQTEGAVQMDFVFGQCFKMHHSKSGEQTSDEHEKEWVVEERRDTMKT